MKNKENELEEILLSNASLDELIKKKIEAEFETELAKSKLKPAKKIIIDISEVPKDKIFSKYAVYKVFNRDTRQETFVNGLQAEAMIGIQHNIREKISKGELSAFTTDNAYVKFEKVLIG